MLAVVTTTIEPTRPARRRHRRPPTTAVLVLPWWRNPVNLVALVVATAALFGALGYTLGARSGEVGGNSVDKGSCRTCASTTRTPS